MSELTLVIGNKNYSSWSLRPWLALRHAGIPFTEKLVLLSGEIWRECRDRFGKGDDFLFGGFGAADAMFAPVVTRLDTYGVELDDTCAAYSRAVLTLPAFVEWRDAALREPWVITEDEID